MSSKLTAAKLLAVRIQTACRLPDVGRPLLYSHVGFIKLLSQSWTRGQLSEAAGKGMSARYTEFLLPHIFFSR